MSSKHKKVLSYSSDISSTIKKTHYDQSSFKKYLPKPMKVNNRETNICKSIIQKQKLLSIKQKFIQKLNKNNPQRSCPNNLTELNQYSNNQKGSNLKQKITNILININSIVVTHHYVNLAIVFFKFIYLIVASFIFSITAAFPQNKNITPFLQIKIILLVLFIIDTIIKCLCNSNSSSEKKNLYISLKNYLQNSLKEDIVISILIVLNEITNGLQIFLALILMKKISKSVKQLESFQYLFIDTKEKDQYFELFKVVLVNFVIGHFLSIFLNIMGRLDQNQNWLISAQINNLQWFGKYVWGYYWGANIMLTVGFGDLVATNTNQALILIFIQTFSCITLAYNINKVGTLISKINQTDQIKNKKIKTFHQMCKNNKINDQTQDKICQFIEQSFHINQSFNYEEYDKIVQSLPKAMQSQYIKQANLNLFYNLGILNNLTKKSLIGLSLAVQRKITYPLQFLIKKGQQDKFIVLSKGQIVFKCKNGRAEIRKLQIQKSQVKDQDKPKLISLGFIKNKKVQYDLRSKQYSVIYTLESKQFKDVLRKTSGYDFEYYCSLQDREDIIDHELWLQQCSLCQKIYHNKFNCDKLHYCPSKQFTILKHLQKSKNFKQKRKIHYESEEIKQQQSDNSLKQYMSSTEIQKVEHLKTKKCYRPLINKREYEQGAYDFILNHFGEQQLIEFEKRIENYKFKINQEFKKKVKKRKNARFTIFYQMNATMNNINKLQYFQITKDVIHKILNPNFFWDVQCDQIKQWKYYFNDYNIESIIKKTKGRMKKKAYINNIPKLIIKTLKNC